MQRLRWSVAAMDPEIRQCGFMIAGERRQALRQARELGRERQRSRSRSDGCHKSVHCLNGVLHEAGASSSEIGCRSSF